MKTLKDKIRQVLDYDSEETVALTFKTKVRLVNNIVSTVETYFDVQPQEQEKASTTEYCVCLNPSREAGYSYCHSCNKHVSPERMEQLLRDIEVTQTLQEKSMEQRKPFDEHTKIGWDVTKDQNEKAFKDTIENVKKSMEQTAEEFLQSFRKFFNKRYEKCEEAWKIEILHIDIRNFLESNEYASQKHITDGYLTDEDRLEPIQNALYATQRLSVDECTQISEGILEYLKDANFVIVRDNQRKG